MRKSLSSPEALSMIASLLHHRSQQPATPSQAGLGTLSDATRTHAALDIESRRLKARKIERLLRLDPSRHSLRLLEIGCGSGGIAEYFATRSGAFEVHAVDVVDSRVVRDRFQFQLVTGTALPFADGSFNIVISNHVIEHVGGRSAQGEHLREIRRVMSVSGVAYLAVPNRWRLIEPHYRLPLLSIWPRKWRSSYLRLLRQGAKYDCEPLEPGTLEGMCREAGLAYRRLGVEALRATMEFEHSGSVLELIADRIPDLLLRPLEPILPTLIYRLQRDSQ